MNEHHQPIEDLKHQSAQKGKDPRTRTVLVVLVALWLLTFAALIGISWNAYFQEKGQKRSLAQQVSQACETDEWGPAITTEEKERLCDDAEKVINEETILGPEGPRGPEGPEGPPGVQGVSGAEGAQGPPGRPGVRGPIGPPGVDGLDGEPGEDGADGADGAQGPPGADGSPGPPGPAGQDGADGAQGPQGPPGVVNVQTVNCEGPSIRSISVSYNPETQTITITCNS